MSLLAYWQINHSTHERRTISSRPASYADLLHAVLLARGVNPAELSDGAQRAGKGPPARRGAQNARAASRAVSRHGTVPYRVVGGRPSPAHADMAAQFHEANFERDWAKRSGSTPEAIRWAMERD